MKPVVLLSPYAGDIKRNVGYLKRCLKDSYDRGEAPFAPHLGLPASPLSDETDREQGLAAGMAIGARLDTAVIYVDWGISSGMYQELCFYSDMEKPILFRTIGR